MKGWQELPIVHSTLCSAALALVGPGLPSSGPLGYWIFSSAGRYTSLSDCCYIISLQQVFLKK